MKNKMIRILAVLLACLLCLTACGEQPEQASEEKKPGVSVGMKKKSDTVEEEAAAEVVQPLSAQKLTVSGTLPEAQANPLGLPLCETLEPAQQAELSVPQARQKPVIFIKDGGEGDGSSADSPLSLAVSNNVFNVDPKFGSAAGYYDSLLYQAAAHLYGTGGTIVICGEVLCDGDDAVTSGDGYNELILPHLGGEGITITSVYDGVDYRETNGARLILQAPCNLVCNNPVTFRDMTICTMSSQSFSAANRLIVGCGFETVMDTGVRCAVLNADGSEMEEPSADFYPTVIGGLATVNQESGTDVTVRSGTYYSLIAGSNGIGVTTYGELYGDSHLTVEGDTVVLGNVSGTSNDARGVQDGSAYVTINGGTFSGKINMSSNAGFLGSSCKEYLTINGGTFADTVTIGAISAGNYYKNKPAYSLLDLSGLGGDAEGVLAKSAGFTDVALPAAEETSVRSYPYRAVYFSGDAFDPTGLTLAVTSGEQTHTVTYDRSVGQFSFEADNGAVLSTDRGCMEAGMEQVKLLYAGKEAGALEVQVIERPEIAITGCAVSGEGEKKSLDFSLAVEKRESPVCITGCGIKVIPSSMLESAREIYSGSIAGLETYEAVVGDTLTASIPAIPVEEYGVAYTAVAYYTFDCGGKSFTAWSAPLTASVYDCAEKAGLTELVTLADSGAHSTYDEAVVNEKIETVVSYMESMAAVEWVAPEEINFAGSSSVTGGLYYHKGETYHGLPYIGGYNGLDNLENFTNQLDENGVYIGQTAWNTMHGNNCTSSIFQSMSRVSNHYDYWVHLGDPLLNVIPKMDNDSAPYRAVGGYTILPTSALTHVIVNDNGDPNVIYESYAQAKRGDYLFSHWNDEHHVPLSHLRLVADVSVTRNGDGTVDPDKSFLLIDEQTSTMDDIANTTWGVNRMKTFRELCEQAYLLSRDASFITGYFETPHCVIHEINTPDNIKDGLSGVIRSNYDLSEVKLQILDADGKIAFENRSYCYFNRTCSIAKLDPQGKVKELAAEGGYEYVLTVTTANAEKEYVRFTF